MRVDRFFAIGMMILAPTIMLCNRAHGQNTDEAAKATKRPAPGISELSGMTDTSGPVWVEDTHSPLTFALQDRERADENAPMSLREETEQTDEHETNTHDYLEISDFFNIREANANVIQGEWEFELEGEWVTDSAGGDDDLTFTPNIKYGITDDMFVELEVLPLSLGDGSDQGNGDLSVQLFNQFLHETDTLPAFGAWVEMRIPTGEGSSGVDAEIHFNLTKTIVENVRAHFEGFVETANGGRGDDEDNRRNFQWGLGPGFDYQFDEKTIAALNYLHRSSEERGRPNQNILEFGVVRELTPSQHLKFAVDLGLDGHEETPNVAAKILWSIEW